MSTVENGNRAAYNAFAWFYHHHWNEAYHSRAFPILQRILLANLAPRARVLDVCCGTGYLAGLLIERGFAVAGVDASEEMVRHAGRSVPEADFLVADVRAFALRPRFQAAVSTFDSLNHILSPAELACVFRNVRGALRKGALFAFDMLLEPAYRTHWGESYALVEEDHVLCITGSGYDSETGLARCRITMFREYDGDGGGWERSDVTVTERSYTPAEIEAALRSADFGEINAYDARDLGMQGDLGEGRVFFTAVSR